MIPQAPEDRARAG